MRRVAHPRACAALALALACVATLLLAGTGSGASAPVTVSLTVPSSASLTNNCTSDAATKLGTVLPGASQTTATSAGQVCSIGFSSSNDSTMLRLAQADGTGAAMTRASGTWQDQVFSWGFDNHADSLDGVRIFTAGDGGTMRRSDDGGTTFTQWGAIAGFNGEVTDLSIVPADATRVWVSGYGRMLVQATNATAGAPTFTNVTGDLTAKGWPTTRDIYSVEAISATTAYIGGPNGWVAKTTNTGTNWTVFQLTGCGDVHDFARTTATDVWLACKGDASGSAYHTTSGGATAASWTQVNIMVGGDPRSIDVPDATHGYITDGFSLYRYNGTSWFNANLWNFGPGMLGRVDSSTTAPNRAWVTLGDHEVLTTIDSGVTWTRQETNAGDRVNDIVATDASTAYIVGEARSVTRTIDGGATWQLRSDQSANRAWNSVVTAPTTAQVLVAVGSQGLIRRSTNGGATWSTITSPTTSSLIDVVMPDDQHAWAVGSGGTIISSSDGGVTWATETSGTTVHLRAIAAYDQYRLAAVGDDGTVVWSNGGGGTSWHVSTSGTPYPLYDVAMPTATTVVAATNDTLQRSTDGGQSFSAATAPSESFLRVAFADGQRGYATTNYAQMYRTDDGGATWTPSLSLPNYALSNSLHVSGRGVLQVGDGVGTVYGTNDDGASWTIDNPWGPAAFQVNGIAVDGQTVVAVGGQGNHGRGLPATGAAAVTDYGSTPSNWGGTGTSSMFGVCLQDVSAATVVDAGWVKDTTGAPTCTASDGDPWRSVPATGTKVAHVTAAGQAGRVDLVWGVRSRGDQAKGTYVAAMVFEVVAPWT